MWWKTGFQLFEAGAAHPEALHGNEGLSHATCLPIPIVTGLMRVLIFVDVLATGSMSGSQFLFLNHLYVMQTPSWKIRKTNEQPESPRRTPLLGKEWKSLPPCPPKLLPWLGREWLMRFKRLGLTVLQTLNAKQELWLQTSHHWQTTTVWVDQTKYPNPRTARERKCVFLCWWHRTIRREGLRRREKRRNFHGECQRCN